jgi:hypothetical protein
MMGAKRGSLLACAAVLVSVAGGCGSGDDAAGEELRQARKDAASAARQDERIKQLERELRNRERDAGEAAPGTAPPPSAPPPASSGETSCGSGVSVGPNTSCPFAHSVRRAYTESGGASSVRAHSPVTGLTYTMTCTGDSPHVCTGGNNASVYFP